MSTQAISSCDPLVKRLHELGVIPPQCISWTLKVEVNCVIKMSSEVIVTSEQFEKLVQAIEEFPEEAKRIKSFIEIMQMGNRQRKLLVGEPWTNLERSAAT